MDNPGIFLILFAAAAFIFFKIKEGWDQAMAGSNAKQRLSSIYKLSDLYVASEHVLVGVSFDDRKVILANGNARSRLRFRSDHVSRGARG